MTNYIVGFLYSEDWKNVLLIRKNRPSWQKGWWNGLGGKVEDSELFESAIIREIFEESGITVFRNELNYGPNVWCPNCTIIYFYSNTDKIYEFKQTTDEELKIFSMNDLPSNFVSPSSWICRMLGDEYLKYKDFGLYYSVDESR